jgi:peptide deformylase
MIRDVVTDTSILSIPTKPSTPADVAHVIDDLADTAANHHVFGDGGCAGLAANQIGYDESVIVIKYQGDWFPMINPVLVSRSASRKTMREGCLSRPGRTPKISRSKSIKVAYTNSHLKRVTGRFTGFTARVIQHELEHLSGVYIT